MSPLLEIIKTQILRTFAAKKCRDCQCHTECGQDFSPAGELIPFQGFKTAWPPEVNSCCIRVEGNVAKAGELPVHLKPSNSPQRFSRGKCQNTCGSGPRNLFLLRSAPLNHSAQHSLLQKAWRVNLPGWWKRLPTVWLYSNFLFLLFSLFLDRLKLIYLCLPWARDRQKYP